MELADFYFRANPPHRRLLTRPHPRRRHIRRIRGTSRNPPEFPAAVRRRILLPKRRRIRRSSQKPIQRPDLQAPAGPNPTRTGRKQRSGFNIYDAVPDARLEAGGSVTAVTEDKFPFIGKSGLTAVLEKLEANAVRAPVYVADPSVQLIYVSRGSGRIRVGGFLGKMDSEVKAGQLVLVPKYFAVGKVAGDEGMECFSIITTTHPLIEELGGKDSIFGSLSAQVFQVSFNVTAEFEKLLRSKITKASPLVPPSNHGKP
ncbi:13S globulin basic chain-like [Momordica charantia]|uniref:13S globulin basic chain-like n=1 Tax=Momordica charantia TaxID=3673 RepID=A0A6J1D626_MOMCH|nr:13S globulin basic chain-like [Momordica charantia]